VKIAGIILIILQIISLIPSIAAGDNIFSHGFANLLGRFLIGIVGVILLVIAYKREKNERQK